MPLIGGTARDPTRFDRVEFALVVTLAFGFMAEVTDWEQREYFEMF